MRPIDYSRAAASAPYKRAWWYPPIEAVAILAIILALVMVLTCTGCRAGSPGVRVTAGAFGVEVSVQVGGGDLAPRVTTDPPPPPTLSPAPPAEEGPKDEEEKDAAPPGGGA